ncbi:hypothetical protein GcM1_222046 [Golovinomyces cichoracearum]|uniref:Large ribosomal subunit protein mL50 n=1 Tax=Golovinomyces cichoracearum TaxID=62708 RepID=A0A420IRC2_9PEZI|nr:hypothetical protein GcM1_222046 [Golovinomyces cichoracearum]
MNRILRREGSWHLLRNKFLAKETHSILCFTCKYRASLFSSFTQHEADAGVPFSEKLRRKIWGTDLRPGQTYPNAQINNSERTEPEKNQSKKLINKRHSLIAASEGFDQYEPAVTWDGLHQIGGQEEMLVQEWLPGNKFRDSFIPKDVITDTDEITASLHRALVEIFVWHQAGYDPNDIHMTQESSIDLTRNVQIAFSNTTGVTLQYPDDHTREKIIDSLKCPRVVVESIAVDKISESDGSEDKSSSTQTETAMTGDSMEFPESQDREVKEPPVDELQSESETKINEKYPLDIISEPVNYQELVASWETSWMEIPITDPVIKFAVIKRITNLSGIRIPDAAITSMITTRSFLDQIIKPPKSQKLADFLVQKAELINLPNVSVHPRRITLREKETAVGRWKLIEEEFTARDIMPEKDS